ncbi:tumor necrosis factor ligand superfamily member 14-like [Xyrauchen texanus]|uniref:tumor necrosis factor ligand superfamily member 14-like n=1 Tax=Xyrauchen texanus TaxID=154827 RepID=UPI0022423334|nr:tumor necrosis factor ligand superfamily member 14-like [Xyrauchen texanus]XP_051993159.1 tumor necrosis factor ligand superfamily member 14-like [Xyrauchen texanus]XP_051993160.1 tumor necrosis factor ligand superfamily member 14-like [Xyrauchen texanus]XP_051993161.1 tumor necrosis factor ligand superfamily member 14-like [Xyrauchen texanus]XP_051993162.1 tumor necrosis factor ligand superfamily member 14-like [Xyrauchen texanus]XP_051993164.1 tumor necrosis factor ligand superfamily memb
MSDSGDRADTDVMKHCPQVFVVDSQAQGPHPPRQVPVRLEVQRLSLIYLLLAVALLSIFIEAGLIYHLYNRPVVSTDSQQTASRKGEKKSIPSSSLDFNDNLPGKIPKVEKPAAFLLGISHVTGGSDRLQWRLDSFPGFLRSLSLRNNSLYFQQEGYYFIFSKISHMENCSFFRHQLMHCSERYSNHPIELMQNSRYLCNSQKTQSDNSYLGGVFHLNKGDSVFVRVNNSSQVHISNNENYFGAFMI